MIALTSYGRIALYFPAGLDINWSHVCFLSDHIVEHIDATMATFTRLPADPTHLMVSLPFTSKRYKPAANDDKESSSFMYRLHCDLKSITTVAWSSSNVLAAAGRRVMTFWTYDQECGSSLSYIRHIETVDIGKYGWPTSSQWTTDGSRLAVGTHLGQIILFALDTYHDKRTKSKSLSTSSPSSLSSSSLSLSSSSSSSLQLTQVMFVHSSPVAAMQWTATGALVAAAGGIVTLSTPKQQQQQQQHLKQPHELMTQKQWQVHPSQHVTCVAVWEDFLFTGAPDGTIHCWNTYTGQLRVTGYLPTHGYPIYGLAISPNGFQLLCGYLMPPAARSTRATQAVRTNTNIDLSSCVSIYIAIYIYIYI
jgi:WD40 repeat protein